MTKEKESRVKYPIVVSRPTYYQLGVLVRQIVLALSPLFAYYGWANNSEMEMWAGAIGTIVSLIAGQIFSWQRSQALNDLADRVPDSVAVKSGQHNSS
jgi:hypothetical protein